MAFLTISFIYVCYRIAPVYMDKSAFEEDLARIAGQAGANNLTNRTIEEQVLQAVRARGFQAEPSRIRITRTSPFAVSPSVKIEVDYQRAVEFPGYVHTFSFTGAASTYVGRL